MKRILLFASVLMLAAELTLAPAASAQKGADAKAAAARHSLGVTLWKAGKLDSALIHLKAARDLDKKNPDYVWSLGSIYLETKGYAEANRTFRAGLAAAPEEGAAPAATTARFYYGLGRAQIGADSLDAAIVSLLHAREADPKDARIYAALGDAYAAQKVVPLAVDNYRQAVELDSTFVKAHCDLGKLLARQRKYKEALVELRSAVRCDPRCAEAHCEMGNVFYLMRKYEESVRELKAYVELEPRSLKGNVTYARALYANHEPKRAIEYAEKAAALDSTDAESVRLLATIYSDAKNDAKAADAFGRLSRRDSLTAEERMKFGRSLAALKRNVEAIAMLDRAAAMDSTLDLQAEIGTLLYLERRYPEAIARYDRRIKAYPKSASTYLNRGISYMRLENFPAAIRSFRTGVELEPGHVQGHLWLAQSYATLDSLEQAAAEYRVVARLDSTNAESRRYVGFYHLLKKNYAAAVPLLERAVRLDPAAMQGHLWLAQAYALNREKDKAIIEYNKVLKIDPKNKDAQKGLELLQ